MGIAESSDELILEDSTSDTVIHIGDIELPAGAKPTIARNFVIANITAPSGLRSSGDEAEAEES